MQRSGIDTLIPYLTQGTARESDEKHNITPHTREPRC